MKERLNNFYNTAWVYVPITIFIIGIIHHATLDRLLTFEWNKTAFIYCYFMPVVIGTLIWIQRREFESEPTRPSWFGLPFVLIGCFFLLLGEFGSEYYSLYLSIWFMILGLCWTQFGWYKLKTILFPLLLLLTTFPPPRFFWVRIVSFIQHVSAGIAANFLEMFQIPVFRQGNALNLEYTRFQVAGGYSGLRYLIPTVICVLVLLFLIRMQIWKRILALFLIFPITGMINGLRIAILSLLANSKQALNVPYWINEISGWFMFIIIIALLYGIIYFLNYWQKADHGKKSTGHRTTVEEENSDSKIEKSRRRFSFPYFTALFTLVVVFFFLQYRSNTSDHIPYVESLDTYPINIETWKGQRYYFSPELTTLFNLKNYVQMEYKNPDGETIDFHVALYSTQSKGKSIHTPETCLRIGNWRFQKAKVVNLDLPGYKNSPIRMKNTVLTNNDVTWIMYFWFRCRERNLVNAYELKFFNFWDRLIKRRTDGALIRVMTPVSESESINQAEQRLQYFLKLTLPTLDNYLPD